MKKAFVIMPLAAEYDRVYDELIKPACAESGLAAHRADEISRHCSIMRDIIDGLLQSEIVIAELTSKNPNVFYELGAVHTLLRPVIVLTQDESRLPFDLRHHRVIQYGADNPRDKLPELTGAIRGADGVEIEASNPIGDFIPGPVLYKLQQANRRLRRAGRLHLFKRGEAAFLHVSGEVWRGLVVDPTFAIRSIHWGASGSSWGWDGHDLVSVSFDPVGMTLGPLPVTARGNIRGTLYIRTVHNELIYFDLYTWEVLPEGALMQVEIAQRGTMHRSAMLEHSVHGLPEQP